MQVRLAFAWRRRCAPTILIVDEALAVGDVYFQHKCIARIRQFRAEGTTLLFVSHDPGAIKTLCDRALLLDGGAPRARGAPDVVLDYYNALIARKTRSTRSARASRSARGARPALGRRARRRSRKWS